MSEDTWNEFNPEDGTTFPPEADEYIVSTTGKDVAMDTWDGVGDWLLNPTDIVVAWRKKPDPFPVEDINSGE